MKRILGSMFAVVGIVLLSGCGQTTAVPSASSTPTPTIVDQSNKGVNTNSGSQSGEVKTGEAAVNIQGFAFSPATLTIKKGTTVTWTNNDSAVHTIKSGTFNSGDLAKGASFKFTFETAGTFDYSCGVHPSMLGKIVVQ